MPHCVLAHNCHAIPDLCLVLSPALPMTVTDKDVLPTLGEVLVDCTRHCTIEQRLQIIPNLLTYERDIIPDLRNGPVHTPTDGVPEQQRDLVRAVLHVAYGTAQQLPGSCIGEAWSRAQFVSQQKLFCTVNQHIPSAL